MESTPLKSMSCWLMCNYRVRDQIEDLKEADSIGASWATRLTVNLGVDSSHSSHDSMPHGEFDQCAAREKIPNDTDEPNEEGRRNDMDSAHLSLEKYEVLNKSTPKAPTSLFKMTPAKRFEDDETDSSRTGTGVGNGLEDPFKTGVLKYIKEIHTRIDQILGGLQF
ncbi:hypothetical protein HAX54_020496 [Datura stramonium]|uniref:Uncharacterized protein n=1 Tax=Datura stramonium TaxID=4076 RepID=A0ABS8UT72_DATST|nr:hypothetical protein [Datura stramonium]